MNKQTSGYLTLELNKSTQDLNLDLFVKQGKTKLTKQTNEQTNKQTSGYLTSDLNKSTQDSNLVLFVKQRKK